MTKQIYTSKNLALVDDSGAQVEAYQAPGWIMLIPKGPQIQGRDGRVFNLENPDAVVLAFDQNNADIHIDVNHASEHDGRFGGDVPAVGWIKTLENRDGEIWGQVEWTNRGEWALEGREYRYLSPVFWVDPESSTILQIKSVGLVNLPNLRLPALNQQDSKKDTPMSFANIARAMGLPGAATEVEILNKIETNSLALNSAQAVTPFKADLHINRADHEVVVNQLNETNLKLESLEKREAETALNGMLDEATSAGKVSPASRDGFFTMLNSQTIEQAREFLDTLPKVISENNGMVQGTPPGTTGTLSAEEQAFCQANGMDEAAYLAAR